MSKRLSLVVLVVALLASCSYQSPKKGQKRHREFVNEVTVKTTPVKNQGQSPLCWAYAMAATIESEHLMMGDSVELSVDFFARKLIEDEARDYFFAHKVGGISLRGMSSMLLNLLHEHGAETFEAYHNDRPINYNPIVRRAKNIVRTSTSLSAMNGRLNYMLDENIGFMPKHVFMLGMEYTMGQFGESVCLPGEYVSLTSFTHHPFGKKFILEMPDNQMRDSFMNVPVDTLMFRVERAIRRGHPVCWEGDISEPGFDFQKGVARLYNEGHKPTQRERQRAFESLKTTDDHCMTLCGLARDGNNALYFLAKNSWGTGNPYGGFMYLSYNYVRLKTIAFYMSKIAWRN